VLLWENMESECAPAMDGWKALPTSRLAPEHWQ
jgi:hypothetical protein